MWEVLRVGDVLIEGFIEDRFDVEGVNFLFLEEFLFIDIVLFGIEFLTGGHYKQLQKENESVFP